MQIAFAVAARVRRCAVSAFGVAAAVVMLSGSAAATETIEVTDVSGSSTNADVTVGGDPNTSYVVRMLKPNGQHKASYTVMTDGSGGDVTTFFPAGGWIEGTWKAQLWPGGTTDFGTGDPLNHWDFEVTLDP